MSVAVSLYSNAKVARSLSFIVIHSNVRWRFARFVVLPVALLVGCVQTGRAQYLEGIDVSQYQGTINWQLVKNEGIAFAFAKATEGRNYQDPTFDANMTYARQAGVYVGPYHFARPDSNSDDALDAAKEANDFVDAIEQYYIDFPGKYLRPVIDVEERPQVSNPRTFLSEWVRDFANVVESRLGVTPLIYANADFANNYFEGDLAQFDLWLARWTHDPNRLPTVADAGIWSEWQFWQWTDDWRVTGISGAVDGNIFPSGLSDLRAFAVGQDLRGDVNLDGRVDAADANLVFSEWGTHGTSAADLNDDLLIDARDAGLVFASWTGDARARTVPESSRWVGCVVISLLGTRRLARRRR